MDIYKLIELANEARKSSAGNLTIGKLLGKLEQFDTNRQIKFTNEKHFDGTWDSYRGYYEDLYIGCSHADEGFNTVGGVTRVLNDALNRGVMEGYKGGTFSVDLDTLVWFSSYGTSSGDMIVEAIEVDDIVYLVTKNEEW